MAKERKVVFSLAVESGRGGTSAVDDLIRKMNEAKAAAQGATAAIREAARAENAARGAAARATVPGVAGGAGGPPDRTFARDFASGMRVGGRAAAEERRERERNLQELARGAERERQILQSRVRANIEASRRIRDAARETTAGHYRGRAEGFFAADPKSHTPVSVYGSGGIIAEEMYRKNMRVIDGYRQIGQAATQAARAVVLLGAANSESAQRALQMIGTFEAGVSILSAAKNLGGGLGKLFGGAGALGGLGGAGLLGTLGTAGAVALPVGMAAWMFADAMPGKRDSDDLLQAGRMRGLAGGSDWRKRFELSRMGIGVGGGTESAQRDAMIREARFGFAGFENRSEDWQSFFRGNATTYAGSAESYQSSLSSADAAAREVLELQQQKLRAVQEEYRLKIDGSRQELQAAREVAQMQQERLAAAQAATLSKAAQFGLMSDVEQQRHLQVFEKYKRNPYSLTREEIPSLGQLGFQDVQEKLAANLANQNERYRNLVTPDIKQRYEDPIRTAIQDAFKDIRNFTIRTEDLEREAKTALDKINEEIRKTFDVIKKIADEEAKFLAELRTKAIADQLTSAILSN